MRQKAVLPLPDRLFADDYSSSGQLAWRDGERGTGRSYWDDDYRGQMRFDSLLSRTLVIPDSHIFDGAYFLTTSPGQLSSALGRRGLARHSVPALEIRGRESTLSGSLSSLLRRPGRATLNAFVFKSIAPEVRYLLAAELNRTPEDELERALASKEDIPAAVASVLEACLARIDPAIDAEQLVQPLELGWSRWLAEERDVVVKSWPTYATFDLVGQVAREPPVDAWYALRPGGRPSLPFMASSPTARDIAQISRGS